MHQAYIFDLDGTLLNTLPTILHYCNGSLLHFGFSPINMEQCRSLCRLPAATFYPKLLKMGGCEEKEADLLAPEIHAYDVAAYLKDVKTGTSPFSGIVEMLHALQEQGAQMAVLSNKPHPLVEELMTFFFPGLFDLCLGQRPGSPSKPDPAALLQVADALGRSREQCVFIGDTDIDMLAGKRARMYLVAVEWGYMSPDELAAYEPDALIQQPADLLSLFATA